MQGFFTTKTTKDHKEETKSFSYVYLNDLSGKTCSSSPSGLGGSGGAGGSSSLAQTIRLRADPLKTLADQLADFVGDLLG